MRRGDTTRKALPSKAEASFISERHHLFCIGQRPVKSVLDYLQEIRHDYIPLSKVLKEN